MMGHSWTRPALAGGYSPEDRRGTNRRLHCDEHATTARDAGWKAIVCERRAA